MDPEKYKLHVQIRKLFEQKTPEELFNILSNC